MSSNITRQELGRIQEEAHPLLDPVLGGDFPDLELAICRHNTSTFLHTIKIYSTSRTWPSCPNCSKTYKCQASNESHTPDIVLLLYPEERSESLEIPAFTVEIVGSKTIWSTDSTNRHAFIGMLESLCYMPIAYAMEIKHDIINIYIMKKKFKFDRVNVESKEFLQAGSAQSMKNMLYSLIDDLSQIFLMIALEFSPCTFAAAKYFQQKGYTDSELRNHGKSVAIHEEYWHLHASAFKWYILDIEAVREQYRGFGGDDDDNNNNHGNGDRQKLLHPIGHVMRKETGVTRGGSSATSGKSATRKYPTSSKSTKAATGGKSSTGGKHSTGAKPATASHWRSNRPKKDVNYGDMPELEDDFDD